jgi:hypothetical protein
VFVLGVHEHCERERGAYMHTYMYATICV